MRVRRKATTQKSPRSRLSGKTEGLQEHQSRSAMTNWFCCGPGLTAMTEEIRTFNTKEGIQVAIKDVVIETIGTEAVEVVAMMAMDERDAVTGERIATMTEIA